MSIVLNSRAVRISLGIIFLVMLLASFVPNLYLYSSSDGVVSARVTSLTSPIEGELSWNRPVRHGSVFARGELIGRVVNERFDSSFIHELKTEKRTLEQRVATLSKRIEVFRELEKDLKERLRHYQDFSADQLHLLIKQQEDILSEERAENARARLAYEGNKVLSKGKQLADRILEGSESDYIRSNERIKTHVHKIAELRNSLAAVEKGVFLGDGNNDVPYSRQRMDQLVIEMEQVRTSLEEAAARLPGIEEQIARERERIDKTRSFDLTAPFDAIVWRLPMSQQGTVVIGAELIVLMDRGSLFLDVALSESQFANLSEGEAVKYRLIGDTGYRRGRVTAMRGSGSELGDASFVAAPVADKKKDFRIWVEIAPDDLKVTAENFYQVGRRVDVRLPRRWRPLNAINRFFDIF